MNTNIRKFLRHTLTLAAALSLTVTPVFATTVTPVADPALEAAKAAALLDAGLTADQVVFTKARLGVDNGVDVYDVEFYHGQTEYDYELAVKDLSILEKDLDIDAFAAPVAQADGANAVTADVAKLIALNDAGVTAQDAVFLKESLDTDNGVTYYDVEFTVGTTKYEYEIALSNGQIVEKSVDTNDTRDDDHRDDDDDDDDDDRDDDRDDDDDDRDDD